MRDAVEKVFQPQDFHPGELRWNVLEVSPHLPLKPQMHEFDHDLIWTQFPNGCSLFVDWKAWPGRHAFFLVSLVHVPIGAEAQPFLERHCETIRELRGLVGEMVNVARLRPSIPTFVFEQGQIGNQLYQNDLILDQTRSPEEQADRLGSGLLEVSLRGDDRYLTVDWEPPRDPAGKFVARIVHYPERLEDILERRWRRGRVLAEKPCRTIPELKRIVRDLEALSDGGQLEKITGPRK